MKSRMFTRVIFFLAGSLLSCALPASAQGDESGYQSELIWQHGRGVIQSSW